MKILVTGGSGYLGVHLRKALTADDFSRRSGLDVLNAADAARVADYDVVIHLAARLNKSVADDELTFLTNIEGTQNILRCVRRDAAFIFASTRDVYSRFADNYQTVSETCPTLFAGQTPLEWSKLIAERFVEYYARRNNFRSCIFRLSTVYATPSVGNVTNFLGGYADSIDKGERIVLPAGGRPRRDYLHVDDLASACRAFVDSAIGHGLYNIGGGAGNALSLIETIRKLEDVSGLQAVIDVDSDASAPVPMNYVTNLNLIKQELGWEPTISVDDGFKSLFERMAIS